MCSNIKTLQENYTSMLKEMEQIRNTAIGKTKEALLDIMLPYLKKFPQVEYVAWRQYTPYFNDGEACEFSVHDPFIVLANRSEDSDEEFEGSNFFKSELPRLRLMQELRKLYNSGSQEEALAKWRSVVGYNSNTIGYSWITDAMLENDIARLESLPDDLEEETEKILKFITSIPDDILKETLGDHLLVRIYPTGIQVEQYEHD